MVLTLEHVAFDQIESRIMQKLSSKASLTPDEMTYETRLKIDKIESVLKFQVCFDAFVSSLEQFHRINYRNETLSQISINIRRLDDLLKMSKKSMHGIDFGNSKICKAIYEVSKDDIEHLEEIVKKLKDFIATDPSRKELRYLVSSIRSNLIKNIDSCKFFVIKDIHKHILDDLNRNIGSKKEKEEESPITV